MSKFRHRKVALLVVIMSMLSATRLTQLESSIRAVDFVAILGLGICCGVMLCLIVSHMKYSSGARSSLRES